ncbi:MAG TPA: phosphatidate cytidylyltransferase [Candidatus Megaira endosymbiont of Nemacystus decipiens]|nr:phosphatidate cytidylyltransferase [Candidatus Megaera endosymbiont of Nemacystus decipiens]
MKINIKPNYMLRFFSAIIIFVVFAISIFYYRNIFHVIISLVGVGMLTEWFYMTKSNFYTSLSGIIIILLPISSIYFISYTDYSGWILFTYFLAIWTVDTTAMVSGKLIQGPKLAPKISPNKTIAGLVGSAICSAIVINLIITFKLNEYLVVESGVTVVIYAIIFAIISQMSDLFVSIFKRKFKIKDTGNVIPGHGGLLDRFDSIILTAPLVAYFLNNKIIFI